MHISYSSLDSFQICPAKYKFSEIDRLKSPKSKEAIFGTIVHETLKMFHDPARLIKPSEEDVMKFFTEKWNKEPYQSTAEEAAAFDMGLRMLRDYYKKNISIRFNVIDLETRFETPVEDGDKETHRVVGKIDRIDKLENGQYEIVDYKTGKKLPSQKSVDENLQLSIYHLGLLNRWPSLKDSEVRVSLYYLKHNEKLSTVRSPKDIKETREKVLDIISQIKTSKFEPNPNPLCDWCEFQEHCPLFMHKFKKEKVKNEEVEKAVSEYLLLKEQGKKNTKRLGELSEIFNRFCDENNFERVFSGDGYVTRLPQERYSYDEEKIAEALKSIGKWEDVLSFDSKKLNEVMETLPRDVKNKINEAKKVKKEFKILSGKKKKTK